ncbi:MAG: hypothetical protein IM537_18765 [Pseudanabaena sp. M57BS1SP1A06MG]|nr:hypothetical protein [Pseudanabaena sp. M34BS1SP1A06MG]MCA6602192.1 hypothetical protein [Pseudanabaena sp. M57BS1SP1A06MG]
MIDVDFYTLRPEVVKSIAKHGMSKAESKLFCYLLQLDPFGDRPIKLKVAEILLATGIGKTAYHQAIAKFEVLGWFDFKHTDVYISNLSCVRKSEKANRKFGKTEKQSAKTDSQSAKTDSRDSEMAQGEEPIPPHTDLINSHNDPDRSEEFFDFENEDEEISEEEAIAILQANLDSENEDLNLDEGDECAKTPEEEVSAIEGDLSRRRVEDFILKSLKVSPRDRTAYFSKFTTADWQKWEAKMKSPKSPPIPTRDLVAEDPHRLEIAIASMAKCRDFEAIENRLASLTDKHLAQKLREKYLCS